MKKIQTTFLNCLKKSNAKNLPSAIRETVFDLTCDDMRSKEKDLETKVEHFLNIFTEILEDKKMETADNITAVIEGLLQGSNCENKERLFKMMYEMEQLEKLIYQQSSIIKNTASKIYAAVEKAAKNSENKKPVLQALNNTKLLNLEMMGILKDVAEEAFIAAIEQSSDIKDAVKEISKTLSYKAISEEKFTLQRASNIASVILESACDIADSDYMHSSDIMKGATEGVKEGILKASEKFKNDMKFAPDEIKTLLEKEANISKKDVINIEEHFIETMRLSQKKSDGISSIILSKIIAEHDTYLAKLKRFSSKATEIFSSKVENFKDNELKEFKKTATKKFEDIKKDAIPRAKQISDEAKSLGLKSWESAKNIISNAAKDKKKK